jgi:hypothetical protein
MEKHHSPRQLTHEELIEVAGIGDKGITGRGQLPGELHVEGHQVQLITANKGSRSQVSFTVDLPERKARHLEGQNVTVSGIIHKTSSWNGTISHTTVTTRPAECHVPGEHLVLSGQIDNRRLAGPGGEAPPSGSYLVLAAPIAVGAVKVKEVFLEERSFEQDKDVTLYGRLEARKYGGVETGSRRYVALSGISDLGAGEPFYDGAQFRSAANDAHLRVLVVRQRDLFDAPNVIVVLDPVEGRAFLGTFGGFIPPEANPFHGFSAAAEIARPTDADRAAVVFNKDGTPIDAATGAELLKVAEQQPPPRTADMFSYAWYFDESKDTVYTFVSGGIAGFVNHMQSVIRFAE